jgi:hypothetical protein
LKGNQVDTQVDASKLSNLKKRKEGVSGSCYAAVDMTTPYYDKVKALAGPYVTKVGDNKCLRTSHLT